MGQTYCNTCCVNEKPPILDNEIENFVKLNDHTPLENFAIKVKQTIELNPVVREVYNTYRIFINH